MKQYILGTVILLLLGACSGMNDNIQEYLDRGEVNYLGRPDSARVFGGRGRINIQWLVNEDPRIEGSTIFWRDRQNKQQSADFPINRNELQNGYRSVVMNLEEGSYAFKIVHTGTKGYTSIATEVTGSVYGDNYQTMLTSRRISNVAVFADHVELIWSAAEKSVSRVEITYLTVFGTEQTVEVLPEETLTNLPNHKSLSSYSWTTYYLPETGALDEFHVTEEAVFPMVAYQLNKTGWTITSNVSGGSGTSAYVIDNNPSTV
jgi:hypothetical protein